MIPSRSKYGSPLLSIKLMYSKPTQIMVMAWKCIEIIVWLNIWYTLSNAHLFCYFIYFLLGWLGWVQGAGGSLEGGDDTNNILLSQSSDLITNQILSSHNQFLVHQCSPSFLIICCNRCFFFLFFFFKYSLS